MKDRVNFIGGSLLFLLASCVTINIYFPAEEVKDAADKIVKEVWGENIGGATDGSPALETQSWLRNLVGPQMAYAATDIDVSTPEIRAIKASIKERANSLKQFLSSGNVGLSKNGYLTTITTDGLALKDKATVNRLVGDENKDRKRLYHEIAKANGFPDKVAEVESIFANSWREQAAGGWQIEQPNGSWAKK